MASPAQMRANRRNAQKSTGPRSTHGKTASCLNALKSGIDAETQLLPGEDASQLEALTLEYQQRFQPSTPEAGFWTTTLIQAEWQIRRYARIEAQLFNHEIASYGNTEPNPLGRAYGVLSLTLARLQRRMELAHRAYQRALQALEQLPRVPAPPPQPAEIERHSRIGFVPQIGFPPVPLPLVPAVAARCPETVLDRNPLWK